MADWTDGAQYAPLERPAAFAMPSTAPLEPTPAPANPAAGQPAVAPRSYGEPDEARPLRELVPATGPSRDPQEPFPAEQTANGTWGAVHAHWEPTMPLGEDIEDHAPVATLAPGAFPPPGGSPLGAATPATLPAGAFPPPGTTPTGGSAQASGAAGPLASLPAPTGRPVAFPPPGGQGMPTVAGPAAAVGPAPLDPYATAPAQGDPYAAAPQQNPYTTVPGQQVPGQPAAGYPAGMTPPALPSRPQGTLAALVTGLGPVMLGALALGVFLPFFSVICYFVASILSSRARIGQRVLRPALQVAGIAFLLALVGSYTTDWAPSVDTASQVICGGLFLAAVVGGLLDLRRQR